MHFSGQSAYELARAAVDEGCVVSLIPAMYAGCPSVYMRYFPPSTGLVVVALDPSLKARAEFAVRLCAASRRAAQRRGFAVAV